MLIYSNNRKSKYHEVPIWKADRWKMLSMKVFVRDM